MKKFLLLCLLGLSYFGLSQTMNLEKSNSNFPEMEDLIFLDFDQDGDEDLAGIENSVLRFYIKDSLADFNLSSTEFAVVGNRLLVEDFDLDGNLDVLVHGFDQQNVFLSNGDGTFAYSSIYDIIESGEKDYLDMDGDGDLDLVLNNNQLSINIDNPIIVFENNNTTGFSSGDTIFQNTDSIKTRRLCIGDFNHDGINDIMRVASNPYFFSDTLIYYFGSSNISMTVNSSFETNLGLSLSFKMADFNNDGYDDVLSQSSVLLFDPISNDYVFSQNIQDWSPTCYQEIIDVNNDGLLDIFVNKQGSQNSLSINTFKIHLNTAEGIFEEPTNTHFFRVLGTAFDVSDLDNDNDFDILFNGDYDYHNNGTSEYGIVEAKPLSLFYNSNKGFEHSSYRDGFDFKDVDNDGDIDVLQTGYYGYYVTKSVFFENRGNENTRFVFEEKPTQLNMNIHSGKCSLEDINGDQNVDIFGYGVSSSNPISSFLQGSGLAFNYVNHTFQPGAYYTDYELVSLNNDSLQDIVFEKMTPDGLTLHFKEQTDSLSFESSSMSSILFAGDFKFIDLDNDGDQDLITGGGLKPDLTNNLYATYYENTGLGNFVEIPNVFPSNLQMNNIQFADADLDGDIDIFAASKGLFSHFNILLQQPDMTFEYDSSISAIPQVNFEFELVDIDGDMDIDIGVLPLASNSSFKMFIQENNDYLSMSINGISNTYTKGFVKFLHMNNDNILDIFIADNDHVDLYYNDVCQATFQNEIINQCSAFTSPVTGSVYDFSGVYYETLGVSNSNGCDSIVEWTITISNTSIMDSMMINSCSAFQSPFNSEIWETTGIYYDTNMNVFGCDSILAYHFTRNSIDTDIHLNATNELTTNNTSDNIQWLDCNDNYSPISGEINQSFTPSQNGSYAIQFSNSSCVDTSDCFTFNTVGLADEIVIDAVISPNPFSSELNLDLKDVDYVWITDIAGKMVWKGDKSFKTNAIVLSTNQWVSGVYLVYMKNATNTQISKLIKH